ncbi:MAG: hypothetical protein L6R38_004120 [Xanthoria sp. 2 TBL-2021]|nr:MAG: hypothetical protein L6R38_004120 [Xanthoria sp. 2 TBL-2021]
MRFGQNLHRYQVVEWAHFYIDYQVLKQRYKTAQRLAVDRDEAVDLTDFRASLHQELSKARSFYERKHGTLQQSVKTLYEHYRINNYLDLSLASGLEVVDLQATCVESRNSFKQLLWFWVVNFDKTLTSLAKFETDLAVSDPDLALRTRSIDELCRLEDLLNRLSKLKSQIDVGPSAHTTSTLSKQPSEKLSNTPSKGELAVIERDDAASLELHLEERSADSGADRHSYEQYLFALLCFSLMTGSQSCTHILLPAIGSLQRFGDHVHQLISRIGRTTRLQDRNAPIQDPNDTTIPQIKANAIVSRLARVIARLGLLRKIFPIKDRLGRISLHHAVEYDLLPVCQEILKHMREGKASQYVATDSPALIPDLEGLTSLDLAVFHGNLEILKILLDDRDRRIQAARTIKPYFSQPELLPGKLLSNAIELQCFPVFQLLHRSGIDVKYADHQRNTALHLAVRSRKEEYVTEILHHRNDDQTLDLDACDAVYGRTPLIMASANGDLSLVHILLQAGADPTIKDHLEGLEDEDKVDSIEQQRRHDVEPGLSVNLAERLGRQHSANECEVFVNFGALDTYKPVLAVDLSPYVRPDPYNPQREADYTVEVRAINGDQSRHLVQLPILEDRANKPWRFVTKDPEDFKLAFTIYHSTTSAQKGDSPIGSAVALLHSLKQGFGPARESLIRNFTIPILHKETLDFIGTVTFYFLIVTPFPHPDLRKVIQPELSFSAKASGASYVEFDVQLTKDDVPIIYHDFLMSETGIDAPLHNLNLEQFMFISQAQSAEGDPSSSAERNYLERNGNSSILAGSRQRSHSLDTHEQAKARGLIERMQHTFEYKLNKHKGFDSYKGNIRSEYIQASFVTLEDLFTKLPESIKFDVEIKYPMLFEAHDWGMETFAVEVNHLVDNVLDRVYQLANDRTIFFSSFSPEVCILLSRKQHVYPVYFLTESGHIPSSDARADSLREAVWFAKSWRLAGVISRSQPLVVSPQLIGRVQDAGLVCISWGELNDMPENATKQAKAGLDAIITNSVKLIAQTLKKE